MSKWLKRLLGVAAVGSAAAGLFYFLKTCFQKVRSARMRTARERKAASQLALGAASSQANSYRNSLHNIKKHLQHGV